MSDTPEDKNEKRKLKRFSATTPGKRFLKLTGMSTSIAGKMAANRAKSFFQDEDAKKQSQQELLAQIGTQVAETLGEMKGAVMKVGQIASQLKDVLPKEVADALEKLQKDSPPMPFRLIRRQLISELGASPFELFEEFDEEPFAAASIGQVHRAKLKDGREVVVKIQYPGVDESCESDLKQIRRLFKVAGLLRIPDEAMDGLFNEIKMNLLAELDYVKEAENARFFQERYADRDDIVIPQVIEELTSKRVITLEFEDGDKLEVAADYEKDIRDHIAQKTFDLFAEQLFDFNAIHADPHPGNFAFRPDGTIVIYDFGAVKHLEQDVVEHLRDIANIALNKEYGKVDQALVNLGVRRPGVSGPDSSYYQTWIELILPAFSGEGFDYSDSRLHKDVFKQAKQIGLKHVDKFQPSPHTVVVDRLLSGLYWNMIALKGSAKLTDDIRARYL